MSGHSPLPWHAEGDHLVDIEGYSVGQVGFYDEDSTPRNQADTEFIVRAVNSHDDLVRACQAALAYLADPASEFAENRSEAKRIIELALSQANGGQE